VSWSRAWILRQHVIWRHVASNINQPSRFAISILSNVRRVFLAPAPNHTPASTVKTRQTNAPPYHSFCARGLPDSTWCSVLAEWTLGMHVCIPKSYIYLTGTFSTAEGCPSTLVSCTFKSPLWASLSSQHTVFYSYSKALSVSLCTAQMWNKWE
jgi:hypothetical protein